MKIRTIQTVAIGIGIGTMIYADVHHDQIQAILAIGCFIAAIAFGLLRSEL